MLFSKLFLQQFQVTTLSEASYPTDINSTFDISRNPVKLICTADCFAFKQLFYQSSINTINIQLQIAVVRQCQLYACRFAKRIWIIAATQLFRQRNFNCVRSSINKRCFCNGRPLGTCFSDKACFI